jgi:hypothetical protein
MARAVGPVRGLRASSRCLKNWRHIALLAHPLTRKDSINNTANGLLGSRRANVLFESFSTGRGWQHIQAWSPAAPGYGRLPLKHP